MSSNPLSGQSPPMSSNPLSGEISPPLLRLKDALAACSSASQTGDFAASSAAVAAVIAILDTLADPPDFDAETTDPSSEGAAEAALDEMHRYLSSSPNQMVLDALSFELPMVLVRFASLSVRVSEMVGSIVDFLTSVCNSREMLSVIVEALHTQINVYKEPITYIPFLNGLSKVFPGLRRNPVKHLKVALPVIVRVLNDVSSEFDDENEDSLLDIFGAAVHIGVAIETICGKLVEGSKEELCAILGLYTLQIIAIITRSRHADIVSSCCSLVRKFSQFLPFCGLSYLDLLTGYDAAGIISKISKEDDDDFVVELSLVTEGACLAVIWGYISDDVAKAAGEQLTTVLDNIRNDRSKRWQAIGMLRSTLGSIDYPWEMKSHSIDLLLAMMDGTQSEDPGDIHIDTSSFMPSLFIILQAIQRIMIGASDASLRKKAFAALKKTISDIPASERFDMLMALITHNNSPSMIAIVVELYKGEILLENRQRSLSRNDEAVGSQNRSTTSPFWSSHVVELMEMVLRPSTGGPPSLPDHIESVLKVLNLYRFILILESSEKTNYASLLSEKMLQKAYSEWFLPLRSVVLRIEAENARDDSELAREVQFDLNLVQVVLYHCIELVEDNLKHYK